ncbi:MAG: ROK family protein [Chloroherpetonaceae bacterium]|nr:ROK family protein [Chloroherpetonaceae bacterium]
MKFGIGVDFGGTYIKFAAVSTVGEILLTHHLPTDANAERCLEQIAIGCSELIKKVIQANPSADFSGIGIGIPGPVNLDGLSSIHSDKIKGWQHLNVEVVLRDKLTTLGSATMIGNSFKILSENDANAAALGEAFFGAGKNLHHFVMITLGTGVGGGIIWNRKVFRGANGAAGELGHITIDYTSPTLYAGIRGSIEGKIGQKQISEFAKTLLSRYPHSKILELSEGNLDRLEPKILTEAARFDDPLALEVWTYVGTILGTGLANILSVLDIRKFIIGGGVSGAGEFIFEPARKAILSYTLKEMHDDIEILPAALGNQAGVLGSAALTF